MHLVFINQYYPPDVAPTGVMLEAVINQLLKQNHTVTVLCTSGGYAAGDGVAERSKSRIQNPEQRQNTSEAAPPCVNVVRIGATSFGRASFAGKLTDYLSFYCGVAWQLATMRQRADRIVAMTTPPYLSVLARLLSKFRNADHAHWVMDLYPDVMLAHGMLKTGGSYHRILSAVTRWGFGGDRCAAVLSIGPDMADRIRPYLKPLEESPWVPLWSSGSGSLPEQSDVNGLRKDRGWKDGELILMYSGNMGLGHLFDELLQVVKSSGAIGPDSRGGAVKFCIYGAGKRRGEIEQFMESNPEAALELHDYVDASELDIHLASADVHIVSLRPEWNGAMVPSKLQGIFTAGRPVIFIGTESSSIGQWVVESGSGWVVHPNNVEALKQAVTEASDLDELNKRAHAAYQYALENFGRKKNARKCANWLSK